MGLSSSKSKTTSNNTTTATPYSPATPYVNAGLAATNNVFNQQQPVLSGLASSALAGYNAIAPQAFSASPYVQQAQQAATNIFNGSSTASPGSSAYSSLMSATNPAIAQLSSLSNGGTNSALAGLNNYAYGTGSLGAGDDTFAQIAKTGGGLGAGSGALQTFAGGNGVGAANGAAGYDSDVLAGKYLNADPGSALYSKLINSDPAVNPYIDAIAQQGEDAALKAANQRFGSSGLGQGLSSAYSDVVSKNVANAGNQIRYTAYNDAANRQLTAASQADAAYANERNNQEGASGRVSSNYNAAQDRALSAANGLQTASQNQIANQLAAAGALSSGSRSDAATRLGALNGLSAANQQQYANQLGAATALGSAYNSQGAQQLAAAQAADTSKNSQVAQMLQALGLTSSLNDASYAGVNPALNLLNASASIPWYGVNALGGTLNTLAGRYGTTTSNGTSTQTSTPSLASQLGQAAQLGSLFL